MIVYEDVKKVLQEHNARMFLKNIRNSLFNII